MKPFFKLILCGLIVFAPIGAKEFAVIGHRGNPHESPENTLSSFRQAIDKGVDYIEFDVHLSKEGVPVVVHDPILGRTTDSMIPYFVNALTLAEIQSYDAGGWFESTFKGERIPTLQEVIDDVQGRVGLMVEIKTGTASEEKLAQEVLYVLQKARREEKLGPVLVGSISSKVLYHVRKKDPTIAIIAIVQSDTDILEHLKNDPEMFALNNTTASKETVSLLHEDGRGVWVWCVDDGDVFDQRIAEGVDGFISNRPQLLMDKIYR